MSTSSSEDGNSVSSHIRGNVSHSPWDKKQLSEEAQLNIECNRIVSETMQAALNGGAPPHGKSARDSIGGLSGNAEAGAGDERDMDHV